MLTRAVQFLRDCLQNIGENTCSTKSNCRLPATNEYSSILDLKCIAYLVAENWGILLNSLPSLFLEVRVKYHAAGLISRKIPAVSSESIFHQGRNSSKLYKRFYGSWVCATPFLLTLPYKNRGCSILEYKWALAENFWTRPYFWSELKCCNFCVIIEQFVNQSKYIRFGFCSSSGLRLYPSFLARIMDFACNKVQVAGLSDHLKYFVFYSLDSD